MKGRDKIHKANLSPQKKEGLKCYFSLLTGEDNVYWIKATGFSMLPLFWPGCRVRLNTGFADFAVGQVVVFPSGGKLIAHRIVADNDGARLVTKGDTLCDFDPPIVAADIVGVVDFVDYYGAHLWVGCDAELAGLSADLGRRIAGGLGRLPKLCRTVCYCGMFFPAFVWLQMRRKFKK